MHALDDVLDLDLQQDRLLSLACELIDALLQRGDLVWMLGGEVVRFGRVVGDVVELLQTQSIEPALAASIAASHSGDLLKLKVKSRLQRVGREMKLVVHNADDQRQADPGLLRILARAHDFQERLMQDPDLTVPAIASQERLTIGYLSRLLRLPTLAPDITTAIINGTHPPQLSAKQLVRLALSLPTDWAEQRKMLRFQER
jgi:site-specific DNA recombinase